MRLAGSFDQHQSCTAVHQAFLEASQMSDAHRQYLMTNERRGKTLDRCFGDAVAQVCLSRTGI